MGIEFTNRRVTGITPAGAPRGIGSFGDKTPAPSGGLIHGFVGFSAMPDWEWLTIWRGQTFPDDLEEPVISQPGLPQVDFSVASVDLERMWEALKARLEATNAQYEATVMPQREAERQRAEDDEAAREAAITEAQRRLEALD